MKVFLFRSAVVLAAVLAFASGSFAATKGRIIPEDVFLQKNGTVAKFAEQTILDENSLIACDGTCMVKLQGITLVALDHSKFAVKENGELLNLYVEQGRVSFTVSDPSQSFAFHTADRRYYKTEGFIAPASTDKSVKGYVNANDKNMEIGMERGSMVIQTDSGSQTVNAGHSVMLALAEVPPPGNSGGGSNGNGNGNQGSSDQEGGFWSNLGTGGQITVAVVGIAAGALLVNELLDDDDDDAPPPPPPPPPPEPKPPRPASPNR